MIHKEITDKQWKSIIPHLPKPETKRQWMVLCIKMGLVPNTSVKICFLLVPCLF